jgi:hypothetical protein
MDPVLNKLLKLLWERGILFTFFFMLYFIVLLNVAIQLAWVIEGKKNYITPTTIELVLGCATALIAYILTYKTLRLVFR